MIPINELRIGNWYLTSNPMKGGEMQPQEFIGFDYYLDFQYGEPIPITSEILKKCGFTGPVLNSSIYELQKGRKFFYIDVEDGSCVYRSDIGVDLHELGIVLEYLHQLQNLVFVLTGEELNVNL